MTENTITGLLTQLSSKISSPLDNTEHYFMSHHIQAK